MNGFLLILLLLAINSCLIAWRADVVRFLPQTASLYAAIGLPVNLRELLFTEVTTQRETHDGVQVLVVEGIIKSQSRRIGRLATDGHNRPGRRRKGCELERGGRDNRQTAKKLSTQKFSRHHDKLLSIELFAEIPPPRFANI